MTTPLPPDVTWSLLERLRDCLCDQLSSGDPTVDDPPCRCGIVIGEQVAWDECCCRQQEDGTVCCGEAWVRAVSLYPSTNFPTPDSQAPLCTSGLFAAVVELGVLRCAPSPDDQGNPPSVEDVEATARQVLVDSKAMRTAAKCCFPSDQRDVLIGAWQPVGPEGGCVGGTLTITVRVGVGGTWPT